MFGLPEYAGQQCQLYFPYMCIFLRLSSKPVAPASRRLSGGRLALRGMDSPSSGVTCPERAACRVHEMSARSVRPRPSTPSVPWSALRAEPAENNFAFAKHAFPDRLRSRPGHVVPLDVFNVAAAVADEVVMPHAFRIESGGATLDGHFAHQSRLHQVPQIVIGCGSRGTRIHVIHAFEDFRSRRVAVAFHQECHHSVALRRAPQPAALQGLLNLLSIHE